MSANEFPAAPEKVIKLHVREICAAKKKHQK